jgi:hypothetical protein
MSISTFTLGGSSPILSAGKARWKPQKGKYRISFVALPGIENGTPDFNASAPLFKGGRRLYNKDVGYFLDNGPEFQKFATEPSKVAIGTVVVLWPVDMTTGKVDASRLARGEYEVKTWTLSLDKYKQLDTTNSEFPLTKHDVLADVTDPVFHKMSFSPARENLLLSVKEKTPQIYNDLISVAKDLFNRLQDDIAQDLTIDQIREKLAGKNGGSPVSGMQNTASSFSNVDDVLNSVLDDI